MDHIGDEPLCKKKPLTLHPEQLPKSLENIVKHICERCGFTCAKCKMLKLKKDFSNSGWKNRYLRPCVCFTCQAEEPTFPCHRCNVSLPREAFEESMWHNRSTQNCVCLTCQAAEPVFTCHLCNVSKPRQAFGDSMWRNRYCQRCVCLTCARPQCTGPQCSTCKVCRDPDCPKGKKCQRQVTELHHKQRPTSFQEVQAYLCSKCKPITCRCGKQLPKKMQKKALQEDRQYTCPDCQTKDLRERDRKRKVF